MNCPRCNSPNIVQNTCMICAYPISTDDPVIEEDPDHPEVHTSRSGVAYYFQAFFMTVFIAAGLYVITIY